MRLELLQNKFKLLIYIVTGSSYWQPMVARQFLRQSPFGRSMTQPPRLVPQASSASLQPPPSRRSPPRRTASFRRGREVKFAEVMASPEPAVWRGPRPQPELVPLVAPRPVSPTSSLTHSPWPEVERTTMPHTTDF